MKILFVAAERAPFAKTEGLGDVIGALPKSLVRSGNEVAVVPPYYDTIDAKFSDQIEDVLYYYIEVGWRHRHVGVKRTVKESIIFYFLDNQYYFYRGHVYGDWDDGERFAFFQLTVIELMEKVDFTPDVVHVHDYHTAMIPFLLRKKYHWINAYKDIRTVLIIHNLGFQGQYDSGMLGDLFGISYERYADGTLRWNDCLNWLKAGILYSDRVTTVSLSYAQEIMAPAFGKGLGQILRVESGKLVSITNGVDTDLYNPETDPHIPERFSAKDLSGKAKDKRALQERVSLPAHDSVPLTGIVSRLTDQKGFGLVTSELNNILHFDLQVVLPGTGYTEFENSFAWFGSTFPDKMSVSITSDIELVQQIYVASNIFLMPSAFEPCGSSQMVAVCYGTLPLVHEAGDLRDTVSPHNQYEKTRIGLGLQDFSGYWLARTVEKAIDLYCSNKEDWSMLQKNAMTTDFSWDTASKAYEDLYEQLD